MPNTQKSHEECKSYVCLLCLRKNTEGNVITEDLKNLFHENVYRNHRADEKYLPNGICSGCKRILQSLKTEKPQKIPGRTISFYTLKNFKQITLVR